MRIISPFRDYYDSYSNQVFKDDSSLIYHRSARPHFKLDYDDHDRFSHEFIDSLKPPLFPWDPWDWVERPDEDETFKWDPEYTGLFNLDAVRCVYFHLLLLGGKFYPVAHVIVTTACENGKVESEGHYRPYFNYKDPYKYWPKYRRYRRVTQTKPLAFGQESSFAYHLNKKYDPILLVNLSSNYTLSYQNAPRLADLQFPLSVHETTMEIHNILQYKDPDVVEVADKYKILGHGYDQSSFRRDKGGPTRKRKKRGGSS